MVNTQHGEYTGEAAEARAVERCSAGLQHGLALQQALGLPRRY